MSVVLVIGSQWGDEGKGKIIDYLSVSADFVVRYHGGNNAGHTVVNEFGTFPLHLIPSGIFSQAKACISNGTVLDLEVLLAEIALLEKSGIRLKNKLYISPRCHVIFPYHKMLDRLYEEAKGSSKTGTTGRGIGPVYADKVSYNGIRLADILDEKVFSEKLKIQLLVKNKILIVLGGKPLVYKDIRTSYLGYVQKLIEYIQEPYPLLFQAVIKNKNILAEGAHGVFLDNDWGTYPYVTASTVLSGGITSGAGIAIHNVTDVIGVVKAYTTRVGSGPFPTELVDKDGEELRKEGSEFGTTTGRPRRCGWFDAELIRFAKNINGYTCIALTKLDVLDTFKKIKICTGYTYKGKKVSYYDGDAQFLSKVQPVYKVMEGWKESINGIQKFSLLPPLAKVYIREIEKLTGVHVSYISTGPGRHDCIKR